MKNKKSVELDVDFIGGGSSLTTEEQKAISEYLKTKKLKRTKKIHTTRKAATPLSFAKPALG